MVAAGKQAEENLEHARSAGGYLLIIEGGIPTRKGFGTIANREMLEVFADFAKQSVAVVALGSCATTGGVPAASPNPARDHRRLGGPEAALDQQAARQPRPVPGEPAVPRRRGRQLSPARQAPRPRRVRPSDDVLRPDNPRQLRAPRPLRRRASSWRRSATEDEARSYCLYKVGCKGPMTYSACAQICSSTTAQLVHRGRRPLHRLRRAGLDRQVRRASTRSCPGVSVPGIGGVEAGADKIGAVAAVATVAGIAIHAAATAVSGRTKANREVTSNGENHE